MTLAMDFMEACADIESAEYGDCHCRSGCPTRHRGDELPNSFLVRFAAQKLKQRFLVGTKTLDRGSEQHQLLPDVGIPERLQQRLEIWNSLAIDELGGGITPPVLLHTFVDGSARECFKNEAKEAASERSIRAANA